jgi:hypothetical protein
MEFIIIILLSYLIRHYYINWLNILCLGLGVNNTRKLLSSNFNSERDKDIIFLVPKIT